MSRISANSLPHANGTLFASLPTASGPSMVSRNVASTTPRLCVRRQLSVEDGNVELQTTRNDPLINSFNRSSQGGGPM